MPQENPSDESSATDRRTGASAAEHPPSRTSSIENPADDGLFDLPDDARVPLRRVIVLAGASGSGKSSIAHRLGVPVVRLDDFYLDHDHPGLPRRHGIVDWDSPRTWDAGAAAAALLTACRGDRLEIPTYDIPTSRRTGVETMDISGTPAVVAEGIFAAEVVAPLRAQGVLAGAFFLDQSRFTTALRRFARDVGEARKPVGALVRRGTSLMLQEPTLVRSWRDGGLESLPTADAEHRLRALITAQA